MVRVAGGLTLGALPWPKVFNGLTLCVVRRNPLTMALQNIRGHHKCTTHHSSIIIHVYECLSLGVIICLGVVLSMKVKILCATL